jgi:hypothetical protein
MSHLTHCIGRLMRGRLKFTFLLLEIFAAIAARIRIPTTPIRLVRGLHARSSTRSVTPKTFWFLNDLNVLGPTHCIRQIRRAQLKFTFLLLDIFGEEIFAIITFRTSHFEKVPLSISFAILRMRDKSIFNRSFIFHPLYPWIEHHSYYFHLLFFSALQPVPYPLF